MMSTLYVFCLEYEKTLLPLPSFCDYNGSIQESTTDDDETDVTTDDGKAGDDDITTDDGTADVDETDMTTDTTTNDSTED
jgi:hypothetical protein